MKFPFQPLFAKAEDPSQAPSGGRGPETPSDAKPASGGYLPADHASLRQGKFVSVQLKSGKELTGMKDPVFGWTNHLGHVLPAEDPVTGWKPA